MINHSVLRKLRDIHRNPSRLPHRHSHQPNNDTDQGKTKHDAIGIELW